MSGDINHTHNGGDINRQVALITGITGQVSFELSEYTGDVVAIGTLRLLEAIRICELQKKVKFYQASSSELYGKVAEIPQNECTPFYPRSPESYGMFACNGILFNHESPRRGETFVTRKITRAAVRIKKGLQDVLELGNLNAERDWGHAEDYVRAMWLMLQQDVARDLVISSGKKHTVREFTELAFKFLDIKIQWRNTGLDEMGLDENGKVIVRVNERYFRPSEVDILLGDCSKAKELLGWTPNYSFHELVKTMVEHDLAELESQPASIAAATKPIA